MILSENADRRSLSTDHGDELIRIMMTGRLHKFCAWSGVAFLLLYLAFFGGVAGYIPPSPPSWGAEQVAAFYAEHRISIQVGQIGALIMSTLMFPFWSLITAHIGRIELRRGRLPVLALMQLCGAVLLQVFFATCSMLWIVASYRPELDAATIRMLHDAGWLIFVMVFPGYVMQMFCIAAAAFLDDSPNPLWPRWVGYLNLWVGLGGAGGGIAVFFYGGPFAWNGAIGFWVPVVMFAAWVLVTTWIMHTAPRRRVTLDSQHPEAAIAG